MGVEGSFSAEEVLGVGSNGMCHWRVLSSNLYWPLLNITTTASRLVGWCILVKQVYTSTRYTFLFFFLFLTSFLPPIYHIEIGEKKNHNIRRELKKLKMISFTYFLWHTKNSYICILVSKWLSKIWLIILITGVHKVIGEKIYIYKQKNLGMSSLWVYVCLCIYNYNDDCLIFQVKLIKASIYFKYNKR